jgi:hypothetical protein
MKNLCKDILPYCLNITHFIDRVIKFTHYSYKFFVSPHGLSPALRSLQTSKLYAKSLSDFSYPILSETRCINLQSLETLRSSSVFTQPPKGFVSAFGVDDDLTIKSRSINEAAFRYHYISVLISPNIVFSFQPQLH